MPTFHSFNVVAAGPNSCGETCRRREGRSIQDSRGEFMRCSDSEQQQQVSLLGCRQVCTSSPTTLFCPKRVDKQNWLQRDSTSDAEFSIEVSLLMVQSPRAAALGAACAQACVCKTRKHGYPLSHT